jgi:hypothetical protein
VAGLQQTEGGVAPDETPAACDQQIGQLFALLPVHHQPYVPQAIPLKRAHQRAALLAERARPAK